MADTVVDMCPVQYDDASERREGEAGGDAGGELEYDEIVVLLRCEVEEGELLLEKQTTTQSEYVCCLVPDPCLCVLSTATGQRHVRDEADGEARDRKGPASMG